MGSIAQLYNNIVGFGYLITPELLSKQLDGHDPEIIYTNLVLHGIKNRDCFRMCNFRFPDVTPQQAALFARKVDDNVTMLSIIYQFGTPFPLNYYIFYIEAASRDFMLPPMGRETEDPVPILIYDNNFELLQTSPIPVAKLPFYKDMARKLKRYQILEYLSTSKMT